MMAATARPLMALPTPEIKIMLIINDGRNNLKDFISL